MMKRQTRQSNPALKCLPRVPRVTSSGGKSKSYGKKHHATSTTLSELQKRFPKEDFTQISPEWQLDWCKSREEVEKELLLISPPYEKEGYNAVRSEDWDELRAEVIAIANKRHYDDHLIKLEKIAGQAARSFVYAPVISKFCDDHNLITNGPWVPFVKKALRLEGEITWEHCMGIYVLTSPPDADPLLWHTDFNPLEEMSSENDENHAGLSSLHREQYLHKLVNVLVPLQDLKKEMGFTVTLDKTKGRVPIVAAKKGQWYALDPGYPHAADGNRPEEEGGKDRLMLNISYVHPDFPEARRKHVISYLAFWKNHLPHVLQSILKARKEAAAAKSKKKTAREEEEEEYDSKNKRRKGGKALDERNKEK